MTTLCNGRPDGGELAVELRRHGSKAALSHAVQTPLLQRVRRRQPEQGELLLELRLLVSKHVGEGDLVLGVVAAFASEDPVLLDDALHLVGVLGVGLGLQTLLLEALRRGRDQAHFDPAQLRQLLTLLEQPLPSVPKHLVALSPVLNQYYGKLFAAHDRSYVLPRVTVSATRKKFTQIKVRKTTALH